MNNIELTIKTDAKTPIEDALVMITDGSTSFPEIAATTNSSGNVSLPIYMEGNYRIKVIYRNQEQSILLKVKKANNRFSLIWE